MRTDVFNLSIIINYRFDGGAGVDRCNKSILYLNFFFFRTASSLSWNYLNMIGHVYVVLVISCLWILLIDPVFF